MCLSRRDVDIAMELMAFPCGGHDASVFDGEAGEEVEKSEEGVQEEEELNKEMEKEVADVLMVDASLPDFSCFSQAWGTFLILCLYILCYCLGMYVILFNDEPNRFITTLHKLTRSCSQ